MLEPGGDIAAYVAFRHAEMGIRALVEIVQKPVRSRRPATTLDYPSPRELGSNVVWGAGLAEGSLGITLTPDQFAMLREPRYHVTPTLFDGLWQGEQTFANAEALEPYRDLTWQDILETLKQRYPRPDIAAFFLKITPP